MSRRRLDPRVRDVLEGASGERLLAWGELTDSRVVVCTDVAVHVPDVGRVPWERVERAAWSEEFLDLAVQPAAGSRAEQIRLRFQAPGAVPVVVRERVQWSVLASRRVALTHPDGRRGGATLTARRSPASGEVLWAVVFESGVDPADPGWRQAADGALAKLRDQLGA